MMKRALLEKLEALLKRQRELEAGFAQPERLGGTEFERVGKELARLKRVTEPYERFRGVEQELAHTRDLMAKPGQEAELISLAREEEQRLSGELAALMREIEDRLLSEDEEPDRTLIVEIRAGTGGEEASLFAGDLFRMYTKFAQAKGFRVETLSTSITGLGGIKEVSFSVSGEGAWPHFKFERGTHRVQRVPVTEAGGRIHTSAVTVAVLPEVDEVELKLEPKDLRVDVYRSSGPGGQGVNTTDSAVRITHIPTGLVVTCQDERSQLKNKQKGMRILRARLMDRMEEERHQKISEDRRKQVGSGDRSEKIRTYNFPDRRVTDHRIGLTVHRLDEILNGELDEIVQALWARERELRLAS
ncbi:MAG: peptide chain release factor 1 [Candidatus Omnitrophica bacterium]|nr:peptide chain release factor 1 [Candidatus Omnitrophota bacterium]